MRRSVLLSLCLLLGALAPCYAFLARFAPGVPANFPVHQTRGIFWLVASGELTPNANNANVKNALVTVCGCVQATCEAPPEACTLSASEATEVDNFLTALAAKPNTNARYAYILELESWAALFEIGYPGLTLTVIRNRLGLPANP